MVEKQCERYGCINTFWIDETHVGKKRQYCSANCRQIVHRLEKERKEREVNQMRLAKLEQTLKQFSPEVQTQIQKILGYSSNNLLVAETATEALLLQWDEMKALVRAKYTEGYEEGRKEAMKA